MKNIYGIEAKLRENKCLMDKALNTALNVTDIGNGKLADAMRYAVLSGGKRIRSFLVNEVSKIADGAAEAALVFGTAIEIGHVASLIHDDLPCMDNSELRHGIPSCHVKFDTETAILAGDALLILAFQLVAQNTYVSPEIRTYAMQIMAQNAGAVGMCFGQAMDLAKTCTNFQELSYLYDLKTGKSIKTAMVLGYLSTNHIPDNKTMEIISKYSQLLGRIFQFTDDILDYSSSEETGKEAGIDLKNGTKTILSFMDMEAAKQKIDELVKEAAGVYRNTNLEMLPYYLKDRLA